MPDDAQITPSAPSTPALDAIAASGVPHRVVRTERASSAEESASFQGIETRQLLRTIVVRRADDDYLFVLVPAVRSLERATPDWLRATPLFSGPPLGLGMLAGLR